MKKLHILFLSILPALVILFCFLGFLAAPNDPEEVVITQSFLAPCAEYPLGTDQYGRCVLSRILYGGYTTLGIVLMGSAIVMTVGILLGLLLGQGKAGRNVLFESILNAVTAIPPIAYLIIFISSLPHSADDQAGKDQDGTGIQQGVCPVRSGLRRFPFSYFAGPHSTKPHSGCVSLLLPFRGRDDPLHFRLLLYRSEFGRRGHRLG